MLRATRDSGGKTHSNIRWNYGHTTIPRHLRDIVVTEYGIADLRGRNDEECIKAMLAISDARFQAGLIEDAKSSGKLPADFTAVEQRLVRALAWLKERTATRIGALRTTLAGAWRTWTYGAVLAMHAVSTLSSFRQYLAPFEGPNILFFAAWPMLAACVALFLLRDLDTLWTVKR
jgi:hypothetical protein